ncbi:MAG: hypothetical protein DIU68_013495 [Chloroflexota bacterium]|nr:MAG: hypothetical protein DIU68_04725 [Chloroflexota bacterium]
MFGNGKQKELRYRAEEIASEAAEGLDDLRRNARAGAEDVKKQAVNLLHQAADSIRREARQRGASKDMRQSADDVARGLEKAAHYLRRHSFEDMGEDVTKSVRRNPWRMMLFVFIAGVVLGLILRGDSGRVEYRVIRNNYPGKQA